MPMVCMHVKMLMPLHALLAYIPYTAKRLSSISQQAAVSLRCQPRAVLEMVCQNMQGSKHIS